MESERSLRWHSQLQSQHGVEYRCRTAAEIAEVLRSQGWTGTLRRCGSECTAVEPQDRAGRQERSGRSGAADGTGADK